MQAPASRTFILCLALIMAVATTGCDSTAADENLYPDPELTLVEDLPSDPFLGIGEDGRPFGSDEYTFFSLKDNVQISVEDSSTTQWDLAFKGTTILLNGGTSGPGDGAAQLVSALFEEVVEAPETGWSVDSETGTAIPSGSGSGWYNYNPATHIVTPIPGRVLLIRTADNRYAKMRILSYYKGTPDTPDAESEGRYITFEYVFQPDGSRNLVP